MPAPAQNNYHFNPRNAALWGILTTVITLNLALACLTLIPNVVLATQLAALCIGILVGGWALYGLSVAANFIMDATNRFFENLQRNLEPAIQATNRTAQHAENAAHVVAHPLNAAANAANGIAGAAVNVANAAVTALQPAPIILRTEDHPDENDVVVVHRSITTPENPGLGSWLKGLLFSPNVTVHHIPLEEQQAQLVPPVQI